MKTKLDRVDKLLEEVQEGMHLVMISELNNRIFYLHKKEEHTHSFQIQIETHLNTSHNSFFFSDLPCRIVFGEWLGLRCTRVRIYQTKEEAIQCVELWKTILFKEKKQNW